MGIVAVKVEEVDGGLYAFEFKWNVKKHGSCVRINGHFRERLIVTSYVSRTHEPCVPTDQVNIPRVSYGNLVYIKDARAVRPYMPSEFPAC